MKPDLRPQAIRSVQTQLLAWFDLHKRILPFRDSRDPYRVWVSEVMLQQTTVTAVVPFFERFLTLFPTVQALANAPEQAVLKAWEGLGYYRRARHLHAAAKLLAERFGEALPDDPEIWAELPGVGRYILGAVLSRAFDRKLPIVEANSLRVLSRWHGYPGDPRVGEGKAWVWHAAEQLLPEKRAGDFNEALMELGALVCTPESPDCSHCPLRRSCVAHEKGLQSSIPGKAKPPVMTKVDEAAVAIRRGDTILLGQRPDGVRWAGMWELPHGPIEAGESANSCALRLARDLVGLTMTLGRHVTTVRHTVTRYDITMTCLEATATGRARSSFYVQLQWVSANDLAELPLPIPQRKLLRSLFENAKAGVRRSGQRTRSPLS
ncbi:MAG: A/G-specific adenine glycosylase [Gemmataceae bacterium]